MENNTIKKPQKLFINFTLFAIVLLTGLLSFILFLSVINVEAKFVLKIYETFSRHKWMIAIVATLILFGLILCIIFFTIQIEIFFSRRIQRMYAELETNTVRGIDRLPIGVVSYDKENNVTWINNFFSKEEQNVLKSHTIYEAFPSFQQEELSIDTKENESSDTQFFFPNIDFFGRTVDVYQDAEAKMLYFFDKTNEKQLLDEIHKEQLVIGYIYIDAPDEVQVLEDAGNINASGEINRSISNWAKDYNVYVRKYSSYRWLVMTNKENLNEMIANQMNLREYVKATVSDYDMNITISGGFAVYAGDLSAAVKEAIEAIELAQSRGGDQVVVRLEGQQQKIFGGDNNQKKRTSRVMVRSTALALHTEISKYHHIYFTAHQYADLDAIGAILGLTEIARATGKDINFVIDIDKTADGVESLIEKLWRPDEVVSIMNEHVIHPSQFFADELPESSLVIVTDVSTPALLESIEIADAPNIIVIDHHRKGQESIENPIFEYIDPFSSSASELVTELIQYQPEKIELSMEVATFLLSGIILDTNKFTRNVSSRTFEAASYLRKKGALQEYVLQVLGTNIDDFITQSYYLLNSENLQNDGRLLLLDDAVSRLEVAKCADFLLSFPEIKYSIVVGQFEDGSISMSARSKGTSNIQRIMEYFGGGGHYNNAAAQLDSGDLNDIKEEIIDYLDEREKEKTDAHRIVLEN